MPQNRHCSCRFRDVGINSVSGPVDVIVPLEVVATVGVISGVTVTEFCWLLFVLLRVARLLARAEIRRFKSSRNSDFSGDTYLKIFVLAPMKLS